MKTRIVTLITLLTIILSVTISNAATKVNNNNAVVLTTSTNINKIEASGNVEVYITNGDKDQVKVYDNYYAQNALVQDKDGVLRISSYNTEKLVVLVTVSNLRTVTASDNATVKSLGIFSTLALDVNLKDNATAQFKLDAFTANFTVNDHAKADITGSINDYSLNYTRSSTVNRSELLTVNGTEKIITKGLPKSEEDRMASL